MSTHRWHFDGVDTFVADCTQNKSTFTNISDNIIEDVFNYTPKFAIEDTSMSCTGLTSI